MDLSKRSKFFPRFVEKSARRDDLLLWVLPPCQGILGGKGLLVQDRGQQEVQEVDLHVKVPHSRCNDCRNRLSQRRVLRGREKDPFGSLHAAH